MFTLIIWSTHNHAKEGFWVTDNYLHVDLINEHCSRWKQDIDCALDKASNDPKIFWNKIFAPDELGLKEFNMSEYHWCCKSKQFQENRSKITPFSLSSLLNFCQNRQLPRILYVFLENGRICQIVIENGSNLE